MVEESETVKVYCRVKPSDKANEFIRVERDGLRTIPPPGTRYNSKEALHTFSGIYSEDNDQNDIFNDVASPLVDDLIEGKNGLLFTYGVTGSGKTYTMQGDEDNPGIVPRALKSLFSQIKVMSRCRVLPNRRNGFKVCNATDALDQVSRIRNMFKKPPIDMTCISYLKKIDDLTNDFDKTNNCTVFISLVEIYGKHIRDLFAIKSDLQKEITIKEDIKRNKYLYNVVEMEVQTAEEAFSWYLEGQKNRKVESTKLNNESSRSHMVFNIRLVKLDDSLDYQSSSWDEDRMWVGQLSLVDLAGSERANRSGTKGARLKEAGDINNSLMVLRRCMEMLRDKNRQSNNKPDYRSSELTHLFKTSLEGGSSIRMIICIQSCPDEYDETMTVLQFAENTQEICMAVQKNPEPFKTIKYNSITNLTKDQQMEMKLNEIWAFVSKKRMVEMNNIKDDIDDITCMLEIKEKSDETLQVMGELWSLLLEENTSCNQYQIDIITSKLSKERLVNSQLKKQMLELQKKLTEKEIEVSQSKLEIASLRRNRTKQDEKIRALDFQLKFKDEGIQKPVIDKESFRTVNAISVKTIAKKFENIECSSKKFVSTLKSGPLPGASIRKGFFNPRYRRSKSQEQWIEHKEKNEIPMGTLNQIKMKSNRKSKNPNLDGLKRGDKYLLQHQTVNDNADVEVSYHKGHIIPTAGGGVAVSLYEVETVTQKTPFKREPRISKRQSSLDDDTCIGSSKRFKDDSDDST